MDDNSRKFRNVIMDKKIDKTNLSTISTHAGEGKKEKSIQWNKKKNFGSIFSFLNGSQKGSREIK